MKRLVVAALAAVLLSSAAAGEEPTPPPAVSEAPAPTPPPAAPAATPPPAVPAARPTPPPAVAEPPRGPRAPVAPPALPFVQRPRWSRPATAIFELGYDLGSTELAYVELSDGSTQRLKANRGFWMSGGLSFLKFGAGPVGLSTTAKIGFKYSRIGVENDGIRYLAFPLEVVEHATMGPFRLGVGASVALNPSITGQGILDTPEFDIDLKNSLGVLFQAEVIGARAPYRDQGWTLGVRYLWQKLANETLNIPVDANSFGLVLGAEL